MEQIPVIKNYDDLQVFCMDMQTEKKEEASFIYKGKQYKAIKHDCFIIEDKDEGDVGFNIPDIDRAEFWDEELDNLES
jgi:hypothetical protein